MNAETAMAVGVAALYTAIFAGICILFGAGIGIGLGPLGLVIAAIVGIQPPPAHRPPPSRAMAAPTAREARRALAARALAPAPVRRIVVHRRALAAR